MSISATAPTPTYSDSERLVPVLPSERAGVSVEEAGSGSEDTSDTHLSMFAEGDDSPSFWDLLDVINPLQHIPVVNTLYREMTGDKIGVGAQIAGGALLGGIVGVLASGLNCVVQEASGKDVGEHVLAMFRDDGGSVSATAMAGTTSLPETEPMAAAGGGGGVTTSSTTASATAEEPPLPLAAPQDPVVGTDLPAAPSPAAQGTAQGAAQIAFNADGSTEALTATAAATAAAATVAGTGSAPRLSGKLSKGNSAATTAAAVKAGKGHAVPERTKIEPKDVATISVPVSNNGSRSNVPATGHRPAAASSAASASAAVTAQKIATAQSSEQEASAHPMVPQEAADQTAAAPDWFTSSMMQALDKYERAAKAKTGAASTVETVQ